MTGRPLPESTQPLDTQASAARARTIIMEVERQLGFEPIDREYDKLGYDLIRELIARSVGTRTAVMKCKESFFYSRSGWTGVPAPAYFCTNGAVCCHGSQLTAWQQTGSPIPDWPAAKVREASRVLSFPEKAQRAVDLTRFFK